MVSESSPSLSEALTRLSQPRKGARRPRMGIKSLAVSWLGVDGNGV